MGESAVMFHKGTNLFIDALKLKGEALSLQIGKFLLCCKEKWILVMFLVRTVCKIFHTDIDAKRIRDLEAWIIGESKLMNCWQWKPLLNGKEMLQKYEKHGLAQDKRLGMLNELIANQRLSKPEITIEELDAIII